APRQVVGEALRLLEERLRLEQVDDVDAVALAEDEAAHLRVPATRLVAEVHAGLQQLADAHLGGHGVLSSCGSLVTARRLRGPGLCDRAGPADELRAGLGDSCGVPVYENRLRRFFASSLRELVRSENHAIASARCSGLRRRRRRVRPRASRLPA